MKLSFNSTVIVAAACLNFVAASSLGQPKGSPALAPHTNRDWRGAAPLHGLRCLSEQPFPTPLGSREIVVPEGDFETGGKKPEGWEGEWVMGSDAPQGRAYLRAEARQGSRLRTRIVNVEPGRPYFLSFRLKSPGEHWANLTFRSDERKRTITDESFNIPGTDGAWKHVGFYFKVPLPAISLQFNIVPRLEPEQPGHYICMDEVRLRTATDAEMAAAYEAERAHYPPYDITPRPGNGSNLALSVAKWENRAGLPDKPFIIWALGSSWTAAQKNGYGLIHAIRKAFPHAPPIVYRSHVGSGAPWDYAAGWVKQFVAAEQPDLIFTYTVGTSEGLDRMLTEIRRRTTADIIVPSMHFKTTDRADDLPTELIETGGAALAEVREICKKHHAEFIEHRRDLADYMKRHHLEPDDMLWDHVHQNEHGRIRIWDNVSRHLTHADHFTYQPEDLERRIPLSPAKTTATESVKRSGQWIVVAGSLESAQAGDRLHVRFTGNRIDLIGRKHREGGIIEVLVDGQPADQAPAFFCDYIEAKPKLYPKPYVGGQPGDVAPHAVDLGAHVVPQHWTITMINDAGDYRIDGSITGPDGTGNVTRLVRSLSGQIAIDPVYWRKNVLTPPGQTPVRYGNVKDDKFEFSVYRSAVPTVDFSGETGERFTATLVSNLSNEEHTLEIVTRGGNVRLEAFYVFTPMAK